MTVERFVANLAMCVSALRQGQRFAAGRDYTSAVRELEDVTGEEKELGHALARAVFLVGSRMDCRPVKCEHCGTPLVSDEDRTCDECIIVVLDSLLASKGWARVAGKDKVRDLVERRKRAEKRVEKRYSSFLRRGWSAPQGAGKEVT